MTDIDFEAMLQRYRGIHPLGSAGDRSIAATLKTSIVDTTDHNVRPNRLSVEEIDDYLAYSGWNLWDLLARRSTEGESGLIPQQEYETVAFVQQWLKFPHLYDRITEAAGGAEGLVELARSHASQPADKLNNTRAWVNICTLMGRGLLTSLGLQQPHDRLHELNTAIQFQRRIQHGVYGPGRGFISGRNYKPRVLDQKWIDRFFDERQPVADDEHRQFCRKFNASTEVFGFLLMFDTRSATNTSGPYELPNGDVMLVRDHFLLEPLYPWMDDAAGGLPYCVTQAMIFDGSAPEFNINDIGTTFTAEHADYWNALTHFSVYRKDRWDSSELIPLDLEQQRDISRRSQQGVGKLYRRIASMSRRDRIMAGVLVYTREMMAPFARPVGLWNSFVDQEQFDELDPLTAQAYFPLTNGQAQDLLPPAFVMGEAFIPIEHSATW
ncbi:MULTISPECIES: hypothetical protein [unclassified Rhodococcus (in: high G+C Gram-positive bacteria)]|uniref:hypothetical protein n=1 Tax=unclassified Rhodococcus (in: high G+C Gram-positive bacteria) TaxID=192944 RepID=UPI00163AC2C6|nr:MULTISPECIES: hypothetical protein [unclassified Rhodococcus (in: high G+C Gram-positive bacteria)]MBC2637619.1 hypothetical protein [Rhodococcus sp. 3A]MBC2897637.1 hypothetical protein [Rhodococcus sp. 4CII]